MDSIKILRIRQSHACNARNKKSNPLVAPLHPWIWPIAPWKRIHIDYAGLFLNQMFLIVVDVHSKWPEVIQMSSITTSKTVEALQALFTKYGLPEQLVSDNGPQFTSEDFSQFMRMNGIKHIRSAPYHSSSNNLAECFVQTFKRAMKAGQNNGSSLSTRLSQFLLTYCSTPYLTTNTTPGELFLQRKFHTRFNLLKPDLQNLVMTKQVTQKKHHDQHSRLRQFSAGQPVMAREFRSQDKWSPGVIQSQSEPVSYDVEFENGKIVKRHVDHLRDRSVLTKPFTPVDLQPEDSTQGFESFNDSSSTSESNPSPDATVLRYPQREHHPPERLMNIHI